MSAKRELEKELIRAEARIEVLEEQLLEARAEKTGLFKQIEKLQDSLISIRAPEAYRDQQIEREGPPAPLSEEQLQKNQTIKEFTKDYFNAVEGPLFRDKDDLDDLMRTGIIRHSKRTPSSLHGNDES